MKVIPIFARVLIRRDEVSQTQDGVFVPPTDSASGGERCNTGTVISVGDNIDPRIKPGVRVYFGKHAGAYIHPDKADKLAKGEAPDFALFVLHEEDIIAVLEDENEEKPV